MTIKRMTQSLRRKRLTALQKAKGLCSSHYCKNKPAENRCSCEYHLECARIRSNKKTYTERYLWEYVGNGYIKVPSIYLAKKVLALTRSNNHSYISLIQTLTGGKCSDHKLAHGLIRACKKHYPEFEWE